jgi:hypothetical protein
MKQDQYEIRILPKGKTTADEYYHRGEYWLEGRENSWYNIMLLNHSDFPAKCILSVDGINVITGEPASFDSRGYVIEPYGKTIVSGWMVDNTTGAQFVFDKKSASYAESQGSGDNAGIIGAAWFRAKRPIPQHLYEIQNGIVLWNTNNTMRTHGILSNSVASNSVASGCCVSQNEQANKSLGTSFGAPVHMPTTVTEFTPESTTPQCVMLLKYDNAKNLERMGIRLKSRQNYGAQTQAFPGNSGYCKPPPGWAKRSWNSN